MTRLLEGAPVAAAVRDDVEEHLDALPDAGATPTLATVLMSDDPAQQRFADLKHETCADLGIDTRNVRLDPAGSTAELGDAVTALSEDDDVDAIFVQVPLPDHVDVDRARERIDPAKDVDCFHPENLGLLVDGHPRFVPATTAAVVGLLSWYDVPVDGRDVTVVGRSTAIGRSIANRLLWDDPVGNATVTVCHTETRDLPAKTRAADVVVTACGVPGLVDGSMLADGVAVVDVSANRVETAGGTAVVGDVDFESTHEVASAITPVPGGVGPVTLAMLAKNVVEAAERRRA